MVNQLRTGNILITQSQSPVLLVITVMASVQLTTLTIRVGCMMRSAEASVGLPLTSMTMMMVDCTSVDVVMTLLMLLSVSTMFKVR